jgi:hypothetical protein
MTEREALNAVYVDRGDLLHGEANRRYNELTYAILTLNV